MVGCLGHNAVATFGAIQFMHSGSNAAALDPAQQMSPGGDGPTPVEYFPAQYVNQATQSRVRDAV